MLAVILASLGVAYVAIAAILVRFVWSGQGGFAVRDIALPPVVLAACLAVSAAASGLGPIAAAVAGAAPLLVAGLLSFRRTHRDLTGPGKGAAAH